MISAALAFLHARKWLVELILLALIVGAVWWFCQHLIDVGVQRQKDADTRELAHEREAAAVNNTKAEHVHDQEIADLRKYRDDHPLHGSLASLCIKPAGGVPKVREPDKGNGGTAAATGGVQPVPAGDTGGEVDQLGMLEAGFARCDADSAALREWQAR